MFHEVLEHAFDSFERVGVNLVPGGCFINDGLEGFGFPFVTEGLVNGVKATFCFVRDVEREG